MSDELRSLKNFTGERERTVQAYTLGMPETVVISLETMRALIGTAFDCGALEGMRKVINVTEDGATLRAITDLLHAQ